jgi:hypothetical protein
MPSPRNRAATATRRRSGRGKPGKNAKSKPAGQPRQPKGKRDVVPLPPPLRTPFFAMPLRGILPLGDSARALAAALHAFARMPRQKSRVLH